MLYTVEDLSVKFNVSKVTIYSKLKLDNIKPYVLKEEGKTKVKDEAIVLIKDALKIKDDTNTLGNEIESTILNLNENLIDSLNNQIQFLREQLQEKDKQLEKSNKLIENMIQNKPKGFFKKLFNKGID